MAFYIIALLIVLQLGIIYLPFMQGVFHTTAINFHYGWGIPIIMGFIVLVVTEIVKLFRLHWNQLHKDRIK